MTALLVPSTSGIVFWTSATWSNWRKLKDGFEAIGYGDYTPKQITLTNALKGALEEVCGTRGTLIRPLDRADGFSVTKETRGKEENKYEQVLMAKLDLQDDPPKIRFNPFDERANKIVAAFNEYRDYVEGVEVG